MYLLWSLLAAFSTAVYLVYISGVLKRQPDLRPATLLLGSHLCGGVLLLLASLAVPSLSFTFPKVTAAYWYLFGNALLLVVSRQLYFYAYAHTDVAKITIFSPLTPLFTILTAHIFLGESLTPSQWVGTLVICGSIYAMFLKRDGMTLPQAAASPFATIFQSRPILLGFLATIPTAFSVILQKKALQYFDAVPFTCLLLITIALLAWLMDTWFSKKPLAILETRMDWWLIPGIMLAASQYLFCFILIASPAAVALVVLRFAIVFQVVLAYVWLKERSDIRKRLLCSVAAIIGFAFLLAGQTEGCATPRCKLASDSDYKAHFKPEIPMFLTEENPLAQAYLATLSPEERMTVQRFLHQLSVNVARAGVPQKHFRTCALVANSPNVLGQENGYIVDAHEAVIRLNLGPTKGYEKDVGKRTTFRVAYEFSQREETLKGSTFLIYPHPQSGTEWQARYWEYIQVMAHVLAGNAGDPDIRVPFDRAPRQFPREAVLMFSPEFLEHVRTDWYVAETEPKRDFPSSGMISLVFALEACDRISAFGFGEDDKGRYTHYFWTEEKNEQRRVISPQTLAFQNRVLSDLSRKGIITPYFTIKEAKP